MAARCPPGTLGSPTVVATNMYGVSVGQGIEIYLYDVTVEGVHGERRVPFTRRFREE